MAREERPLNDESSGREMSVKTSLATLAIMLFTVALADGMRLPECGLLADDWDQVGKLVWGGEARHTIHDQFLFGGEGRPLRALDQSLIVATHALGGITGVYALVLAVIAMTGFVLSTLAARRLSRPLAIFVGVLFVLNPADTTHLWAATLNARLGILFALAAAWAFTRGRHAAAFIGCLAALFSYETSVLAFALAPWAADGGRPRTILRGAAVAAAGGATYFIWRLLILARLTADFRMATLGLGAERTTADRAGDVFGALPLMLVEWPRRAVEVVFERGLPHAWWWVAGVAAIPLLLIVVRSGAPVKPREHALVTLGHGLLLTLAAALVAIVRPPMLSLGVESRYNLALVPAASLTLVALLALASRVIPERWRWTARIPVAAILLLLIAFRMHVRDDYVEAAADQRRAVTACVEEIGPLPPHTVVVLANPFGSETVTHERAIDAFVTGFDFELAPMFGLLYDPSILAVAHGDARDVERGLIDATGRLLAERPLRCNVVVYDVLAGTSAWLNRGPLGEGAPLAAGGPALEYLKRR